MIPRSDIKMTLTIGKAELHPSLESFIIPAGNIRGFPGSVILLHTILVYHQLFTVVSSSSHVFFFSFPNMTQFSKSSLIYGSQDFKGKGAISFFRTLHPPDIRNMLLST